MYKILEKREKNKCRNFLQSVLGFLNSRMISRNESISVWKNLTDPSFYMCINKCQIIGMYHLPSNMKSILMFVFLINKYMWWDLHIERHRATSVTPECSKLYKISISDCRILLRKLVSFTLISVSKTLSATRQIYQTAGLWTVLIYIWQISITLTMYKCVKS